MSCLERCPRFRSVLIEGFHYIQIIFIVAIQILRKTFLFVSVLGVGRSDGSVTLIGVEKGDTLHTHTFTRSISSLHWMVQDESR